MGWGRRMTTFSKPFLQSYWVQSGLLCAGQYPGDMNPAVRDEKICGLLNCGLRRIVSLMEPDETSTSGTRFAPYLPRLQDLAAERGTPIERIELSIRDASVPTPARMREILSVIEEGIARALPTYLHCYGGHGRTGTVVACHLIEQGRTAKQAIDEVQRLRSTLPKSHDPFEGKQREFILGWQPKERK
jgi:hypothetical protein